MNRRFWFWIFFIASLLWPTWTIRVSAQTENPQVLVLKADGALTPAMLEYLKRGIRTAEGEQAELIIFQLNTPGGSLTLMNEMVQVIRASAVPVVVYIAPRGAMAGSAGTMITLAGHAAAMAPETTIGAASPVGPGGEDLNQTAEAKEKEILKATVRSLAAQRGPAAVQLAEATIESARAASAQEAFQVRLIDIIANNESALLRQLDGFRVQLPEGERVLHTMDAQVTEFPSSFVEQLLSMMTNPNIVFVLLLVGFQAILIEIASPGGWVAGFIGVICLALSGYGLGILPINWFGIIFLITAFVLFILDIKAPTHGALTVAGVASLIVGSLVLFNSPSVPTFQRVSVPLIVGVSMTTGALFFGVLIFALRAQQTPIRMGHEGLIGHTGIARTDLAPSGMVQLASEQWSAELAEGVEPLPKGTRVVVEQVRGIHLVVRKAETPMGH